MNALRTTNMPDERTLEALVDTLHRAGLGRRRALRKIVAAAAAMASTAVPARAGAAAPLLARILRFLFSGTFTRETLKGIGMVTGRALRHAVAPVTAATRLTASQMLANGAALGMIGISAYQLASVLRPEWIEAMARRAPDLTIDRAQLPDAERLGYVELEGTSPLAQDTFITSSVSILPQEQVRIQPDHVAGLQLHGGQRLFRAGEMPTAVVAVPALEQGRYVLFGGMMDVVRQRYFEESGGELPPFRVLAVK